MTSVELVVRCTKGEDFERNPVRLIGEGRSMTRIIASASMRSVLHLNSTEEPVVPSPGGHSANGHAFESISFNAASLAEHAVFAPATTRSSFRSLGFYGARSSGLFLGYGWINVIAECKFAGNGLPAALHLDNNINSVQVLNNIVESNRGIGILVNGGAAVDEGNCIESA